MTSLATNETLIVEDRQTPDWSYLLSIVLAVPTWINERDPEFLKNLEQKLSNTVQAAIEYQKALRYKISPESLQTSILLDSRDFLNSRILNATRISPAIHLQCIFAVLLNGFYLEATSVANDLNRLGLNELSAKIGYSVIRVRGLYEPDQSHQTNYWIIGAVTGIVVILLFVGWCILFVYYNVCCGPNDIVVDKRNFDQQKAVDFLVSSSDNLATIRHKAIQTDLEKSLKTDAKVTITTGHDSVHDEHRGKHEASQTNFIVTDDGNQVSLATKGTHFPATKTCNNAVIDSTNGGEARMKNDNNLSSIGDHSSAAASRRTALVSQHRAHDNGDITNNSILASDDPYRLADYVFELEKQYKNLYSDDHNYPKPLPTSGSDSQISVDYRWMARSNWILSCCTLMYLSFVIIGIVFCSIDLDRFAWCLYLILVSLVGLMICAAFCISGRRFETLPGRDTAGAEHQQHSQAARLLIATFQRGLMRSAAVGGFRTGNDHKSSKVSNKTLGSKTSSTALTRPTLLDVHAR